MKTWLKGGIIGLIVGIVLFIVDFGCAWSGGAICSIFNFNSRLINDLSLAITGSVRSYPMFSLIFFLLLGIILGSLIGLIIGKIKNAKNINRPRQQTL